MTVKTDRFTVRLSPDLKARAEKRAAAQGQPSLSAVVEALVARYADEKVTVPAPRKSQAEKRTEGIGRAVVVEGLTLAAAGARFGVSEKSAWRYANRYRQQNPTASSS